MFLSKIELQSNDITVASLVFEKKYYNNKIFSDENIVMPDSIFNSIPDRQAEFLAGRLCAKKCLELNSSEAKQVAIGENREPIWPKGLFGSITHSGSLAASVVSSNFSVGIDIESVIDEKVSSDIRDIIATNEEESVFEKELVKDYSTSIIFSFKESIYKCLFPHVNRFFDFKDAYITSLSKVNDGDGYLTYELSAVINKDLSNDIKEGHRLYGIVTVTESKLASLCVQELNISKNIKSELISASEMIIGIN
jgi:enterobactin synthetase component D